MEKRYLGKTGIETSALGLGCMAMSEFYGAFNNKDSMKTLNRAMDLGVTMLDTADLYGDGENELLISRFLKQSSHKPLIASKCGIVRTDEILSDGNFKREFNARPDYIFSTVDDSLKRLGVDTIDLYYLHRVDPNVPVEESIGALSDLVAAGKIRAIGMSEPSIDSLRRANSVYPIAAIQSEYSLWTRLIEKEILPLIREIGSTLICFSPLGRGLIRDNGSVPKLEEGDFRLTLPRFSQESLAQNEELFNILDRAALETELTVPQILLRWLLDRGDDIIPIPGSRKIEHLEQNMATIDLELPESWQQKLSETFTLDSVKGGRYTEGKPVKE